MEESLSRDSVCVVASDHFVVVLDDVDGAGVTLVCCNLLQCGGSPIQKEQEEKLGVVCVVREETGEPQSALLW